MGMIPAIWGPLCWRIIHGAAHRYDTVIIENTDPGLASVFSLFLLRLAWVLPCVYCREGYTAHIVKMEMRDAMGKRRVDRYFETRDVRLLAMHLHNEVNRKLGKPLLDNYELVKRRSSVWSSEFLPREFFGLLFIVAINFDSNGEPDKARHHVRFFSIVAEFCFSLGLENMGAALSSGVEPLESVRAVDGTLLFNCVYDAYQLWAGGARKLSEKEARERYTLCSS